MTNYEVFREFESGLSESDLEQAVERSSETVEEMRSEGTTIAYLGSEVFVDEEGSILATMCRYDADAEDTIHTHSERAELPVSNVFLRATPVEGISPKAGVVPKAA